MIEHQLATGVGTLAFESWDLIAFLHGPSKLLLVFPQCYGNRNKTYLHLLYNYLIYMCI